jgi:hypothetical protein
MKAGKMFGEEDFSKSKINIPARIGNRGNEFHRSTRIDPARLPWERAF